MKGGGGTIILNAAGMRRQCIEARSADARKKNFAFNFYFSGWALVAPSRFCTASSRCTRIAGPRAAMSFFLQISLTNVRTRTRRGILDRGLVPKPFGFRQRTVSLLRAEEARPGVAT